MPLVPFDEIIPVIVCPRCRHPVDRDGGGVRCSSDECGLGRSGPFQQWNGVPALVDFDQSIIVRMEADELPAPVRRPMLDRFPRALRAWWRPRNTVAAANIDMVLAELGEESPRVLVVGGATIGNGVETLYERPTIGLIGFDIYPTETTQFVADAHQIPLADGTVDAVVVQAVLEHVLHPETVVSEIHRVLRKGGIVYAETPFLQQVHAGPYDFNRYTSSGHRYLFRKFDEIASGPVAGAGTQVLWSLDHLTRGLARSHTAGRVARGAFFWLRYLDRLIAPSFSMDDASAYFFVGRRGDVELSPAEIVAYYRGAQR
jgi:SAM-dependent methyltransferase